eukprot:scaffold162125_cov19-Tisochrysis_lutea.AAC.1
MKTITGKTSPPAAHVPHHLYSNFVDAEEKVRHLQGQIMIHEGKCGSVLCMIAIASGLKIFQVSKHAKKYHAGYKAGPGTQAWSRCPVQERKQRLSVSIWQQELFLHEYTAPHILEAKYQDVVPCHFRHFRHFKETKYQDAVPCHWVLGMQHTTLFYTE